MGKGVASLTISGVQEFHFPHFSSNLYQLFLFSPQIFPNFRPHFGPRVGDSPTLEGPGYATVYGGLMQIKKSLRTF